jgi:hypothetical protein
MLLLEQVGQELKLLEGFDRERKHEQVEVVIGRSNKLQRDIGFFLAKEKSSGRAILRGCPFQPSSQSKQEAPSQGEIVAIPLNLCSSLSKSHHQKEPFLV